MRTILALLLLLALNPAQAHLLNMTQVRAEVAADGALSLEVTLDLLRANGSPAAYHTLAMQGPNAMASAEGKLLWHRMLGAIEAMQGDARVALALEAVELPDEPLQVFESPTAWPMTTLRLRGEIDTGEPLSLRFRSDFPFEEPIAVSFSTDFNERRKSRWLIANQSSPVFAAIPSQGVGAEPAPSRIDLADLASAAWQGVLHVLPGGIDHLLFLLCLFLATRTWRERLVTITLFTVAHSVTLGLAAYRVIELPVAWVEAAIAATILVVALENLRQRRARAAHWLVILCFGLIHGFGFASALRQLALPGDAFLASLLAFNVGVEIGQLAFLLLLWLALARLVHYPWYRLRVAVPLSALAAVTSGAWLVQRLAQT